METQERQSISEPFETKPTMETEENRPVSESSKTKTTVGMQQEQKISSESSEHRSTTETENNELTNESSVLKPTTETHENESINGLSESCKKIEKEKEQVDPVKYFVSEIKDFLSSENPKTVRESALAIEEAFFSKVMAAKLYEPFCVA